MKRENFVDPPERIWFKYIKTVKDLSNGSKRSMVQSVGGYPTSVGYLSNCIGHPSRLFKPNIWYTMLYLGNKFNVFFIYKNTCAILRHVGLDFAEKLSAKISPNHWYSFRQSYPVLSCPCTDKDKVVRSSATFITKPPWRFSKRSMLQSKYLPAIALF